MLEYFGDRRISVCRELTKIHEQVLRTTISGAIEYFKENKPRGEFVLIIEGAKPQEQEQEQTLESVYEQVKGLIDGGMRAADACKEIAKVTRFSKSELYSHHLKESK